MLINLDDDDDVVIIKTSACLSLEITLSGSLLERFIFIKSFDLIVLGGVFAKLLFFYV